MTTRPSDRATTLTTPEALDRLTAAAYAFAGEHGRAVLDARAHLASRIAELEQSIMLITEDRECYAAMLARAEAELAAVRASIPAEVHERGDFERGYNAAVRNFDAAREGK